MHHCLKTLKHAVAFGFLFTTGGTVTAQGLDIDKRSERILYGFVPDVTQLHLITRERLKEVYGGKTVRGIYRITPHNDQRFVEVISKDGRTQYSEGGFNSAGRWEVVGDTLCFYYDEAPNVANCFYEYEYGDCIVSYSDDKKIVRGLPDNPAQWGSVQQFTAAGFTWPKARGSSESKAPFVCQALTS